MNMFYKLWHDAERGKNDYKPLEVHWSAVPGRDAKWKEETIRNTSERQFTQEFSVSSWGLSILLLLHLNLGIWFIMTHYTRNKGLDVYEEPKPDHQYLMTVDVARGTGKDYSAF